MDLRHEESMKVRIGPIEYEIVFEKLTDNDIGEISYRKAVITIDDTDMPEQVKRHVLSHEIAHGIMTAIARDDQAAEALGNALLAFVRDNPEVIEFLQKP